VRGTDLKTAIQQRGSIHPRKVAEIGSQVCSALSVAHGYDIIHRDIKSANIMVQGDGNVKVMDFGIAQAGHPGMTQDSSVLGTAHYVSPEQAQGKKLTPASDLYSLGIVLYEAATGQLPFDGPDVVSVAMKQVSDLPVPPRQINPNIDPQFEAIIMTALQKNPDDRFATAKEMQRAIDDYLTGRATAETQVLNRGYAAVAGTTVPYGVDQTTVMPNPGQTTVMPGAGRGTVPPKRNNTKRNVILAVIAVVLIAGIGFFVANAAGLFGGSVTVPNVVGYTEQDARDSLRQAGLKVGRIKLEKSNTVPEGMIISQDPKADTQVQPGSVVNLTISSKADTVNVPNLKGLTAAEAEQQLAALGLVGVSKQDSSDTVEAGKVCDQDPAVNSQVAVGSTVTYTVSTGKKTEIVSVPDVRGMGESKAAAALQNRGLSVSIDYESSTSASQGEVIHQSISPGTEVTKGSSITIIIAVSPNPSEPSTPDTPGGDNPGGDTGGGEADGGETPATP
jgi:beta-lactam-binding protein with PASTA domain